MIPFTNFIFIFLLSFTHGEDEVNTRLSQIEGILSTMKDDYDQRQQDLESRVAKLEELIRIGTLRSCAEYSQYGLKTDGFYQIDPDGPLLGHPLFQVFCNFTSGTPGISIDLIAIFCG